MKVLFLGWCKEGNHDKVWGVAFLREGPSIMNQYLSLEETLMDDHYLFFWGRRDKKLQYKVKADTHHKVYTLVRSKIDKGYREFDPKDAAEISARLPKDIFKLALRAEV